MTIERIDWFPHSGEARMWAYIHRWCGHQATLQWQPECRSWRVTHQVG